MVYNSLHYFFFFFFNDTATTEIYTLSLHDALPIWRWLFTPAELGDLLDGLNAILLSSRSEEHTSELQSRSDLVCRLLLEKKKNRASSASNLSTYRTPATIHPTIFTSNVTAHVSSHT